MNYDFDTPAPRAGSGAIKWDLRGSAFGSPEALPFWIADSDYMSPPELVDALCDAVRRCVFGYNDPSPAYRQAVANWVETRHGWKIDTDWILPATGVVSEIANIVRAFTAPGDKILIQTPVYDPFAGVVKAAGRTVVENRLVRGEGLRYTMDLEDLERDLRSGVKLMILCSPHNPVGRVWTPEEVRSVAELCERHGTLLVSDEIHWDLIMPGHRHFTAGLAGTPDNLIVLTAPSKTFNVAGLKCSNAIIPGAAVREKLSAWQREYHIETPNDLGLVACEAAYRNCAAWCDRQNEYLAGNAALVREYLSENLPEVRVAPLEGTYLMWLDTSASGVGSRELCLAMNAAGAILNDGWRYGDDAFVRLNIACPRSQLAKGLEAVVKGYRSAKSAGK